MPRLEALSTTRSKRAKQQPSGAAKQETRAKSAPVTSLVLIDCGKASETCRRGPLGGFIEAALPPFMRFYF
jgi:hypothetical protein